MPQKAPVGILIIDPQLEGLEQGHDGLDDPVSPHVLNQAALYRYHPVGALLVHARDGVAPLVHRQHGMHLAAVVQGIVHAQDGLHGAKLPQELLHPALLERQLLPVAKPGQLAAAAAGGYGTVEADIALGDRRILHGENSFCVSE